MVIQCYKTAACFATCWLALLLTDFTFTPWGIVGGLIWVRRMSGSPRWSLAIGTTLAVRFGSRDGFVAAQHSVPRVADSVSGMCSVMLLCAGHIAFVSASFVSLPASMSTESPFC